MVKKNKIEWHDYKHPTVILEYLDVPSKLKNQTFYIIYESIALYSYCIEQSN